MEGHKKFRQGAFDTARRRRRYGLAAGIGAAMAAVAAISLIYVVVTMLMPSATLTSSTEGEGPSQAPQKPAQDPGSGKGSPDGGEPDEDSDNGDTQEPVARAAPIPPPEKSCDDLRVLVDRQHALPPYYAPPDLVSVAAYGAPVMQGTDPLLRKEAARQLARLTSAAAAAGEELVVASAYRSYAEQQETYARYTTIYGQGAGSVSAPPGQSQHQLGTAVDFTNSAAEYNLWWPFGDTTASAWLVENAPDYGYVLAYPKGVEQETGYQYEPWHYRYVGKENVRLMQQNDASLQAFLIQQNVVPKC